MGWGRREVEEEVGGEAGGEGEGRQTKREARGVRRQETRGRLRGAKGQEPGRIGSNARSSGTLGGDTMLACTSRADFRARDTPTLDPRVAILRGSARKGDTLLDHLRSSKS